MKRTTNEPIGTGSVFENKARGTWVAQVYFEDEYGRKRRRAKGYATEAEARAALADLRREHDVKPGASRGAPAAPIEGGTVFWDRTRQRWVGQYRLTEGGKRRTKTVVRGTEAEARAALAELSAASLERRPVVPVAGTVSDWLTFYVEHVLPTEGLAPDTESGVRGYVRRELLPSALAPLPLADLTALDIYRYVAALTASGRGASTVKMIRVALSKALKAAVLYGRLSPTVMEALAGQKVPRGERTGKRRRVKMLTHEQASALLAAAEPAGFGPLLTVMLGTGLRRGEVLALRWSHLDFEAGTMEYVAAISGDGGTGELYGPTKTGVETTDALAPLVLDALRRQRTAQAEQRLACPLPWGAQDEFDDFVFTNAEGRRYRTDYVTKRVAKIAREAGIGHVTPHMLRHSAASFLAAGGAPLPVIQRVLHHADEGITRDVYVHLMEAAYRGGTEALEAVLRELASGE